MAGGRADRSSAASAPSKKLREKRTPAATPLDSGEVSRRGMLVVAAAAFTISQCVYARSAYVSLAGGDSGELLAEACVGGVAHPPGYPIQLGLFRFAFKLFAACGLSASPGRIGALLSSFLGATAVGAVGLSAGEVASALRVDAPTAAAAAAALWATSPLPWEYAAGAEVFALNHAIVGAGCLATCWCFHPRRVVSGVLLGATLSGAVLAHQHAAALTVIPLAVSAMLWLQREGKITAALAFSAACAGLASAGLPIWHMMGQSAIPTAGSWGDLANVTAVARHVLRSEYGTFRLGAGTGDTVADAWPRIEAHLRFAHEQTASVGLGLGLAGAGTALLCGTRAGKCLGLSVLLSWVLYVVIFHAVWSNLPIFDSDMAFEVHARFWMQPCLLLCIMAGVGTAGIIQPVLRLSPSWARSQVPGAVCAGVVACAVARGRTLAPLLAFGGDDGLVMHRHAAAILDALPQNALLLSHTDLSWNTVRYLRECEGQRPDLSHVSLQIVAYDWFERQKGLYPHVSFPARFPGISTQVQSPNYVRLLREILMANLANSSGGVFLDLHGVYEPHVKDEGNYHDSFTLLPWGPVYRVLLLEPSPIPGSKWLATSTAQLAAMKRGWPKGPPSTSRFRRGTWEFAVSCAYHDSIYQTGLFALTHGTRLASGLSAERLPAYISALRVAAPLVTEAARAAKHNRTLSSSLADAEKNALVALVHLHKALTVGLQFAGRAPFEGAASRRSPTQAELDATTAQTAAAARRYVRERPDDPSAQAFSDWLKTNS